LLVLRAPQVLDQIELDPEGDGLRVWSSSQAALTQIARLVTEAHGDPQLLAQAIERADRSGQME
jgi:hypothetical protein